MMRNNPLLTPSARVEPLPARPPCIQFEIHISCARIDRLLEQIKAFVLTAFKPASFTNWATRCDERFSG
jgi:hypothetical protein